MSIYEKPAHYITDFERQRRDEIYLKRLSAAVKAAKEAEKEVKNEKATKVR